MKIFGRKNGGPVRSNGLAPLDALVPGRSYNLPAGIPLGQGVGTTGTVNAIAAPRVANRQIAAIAHAGLPVE